MTIQTKKFQRRITLSRKATAEFLRWGGMTDVHELAEAVGVSAELLQKVSASEFAEAAASSLEPKKAGIAGILARPVRCLACASLLDVVPCVCCRGLQQHPIYRLAKAGRRQADGEVHGASDVLPVHSFRTAWVRRKEPAA